MKREYEVLLVLALFVAAFWLRMIPSQSYPQMTAFDPYYHARVTRYILTEGGIPEMDPLSGYPESYPMLTLYPHFFHYSVAGAYWLVSLVMTGGFGYDESLFVRVTCSFAAFAGALGVVALFFLGRELRDWKAGLVAGLLLMFNSVHLFRSIYGFAEDDAFGIFFFVGAFAAFVWALKRGDRNSALVAGLLFSLLMVTWRMFLFAVPVLCLFVLLQAVFVWHGSRSAGKVWELVRSFSWFCVLPLVTGVLFLDRFLVVRPQDFMIVLAFLIPTLAVLHLFRFALLKNVRVDYKAVGGVVVGLVVLALFANFFFSWLYNQGLLSPAIMRLLQDPTGRLMQTVGEAHAKTFEGVMQELGFFQLPFLLALVYLPLRRLVKHRDLGSYDLLAVVFLVPIFFLYVNEAKMGYLFAPAAALAIGLLFSDMVGLSGALKEKLGEKAGKVWTCLVVVVLVLLFGSMFFAAVNDVNQLARSGYSMPSGWVEFYDYMQTQDDSVLMSWWDYGHWSAWYGFKTTLDNVNYNVSKVQQTARVFTDWRGSSAAEIEVRHLGELGGWNVSHVVVDRTLLFQKWGALTFLGDNVCIPTRELEEYTGLRFKPLENLPVCGYGLTYQGNIGLLPCVRESEPEPHLVCPVFEGAALYLTEGEWQEILDTPHPGYDLSLPDGSFFKVYAQPDDMLMFFHAGGSILEDAPVNYMLGPRLFFRDPSTSFSLVYANEEVVAYAVNRTGGFRLPSGERTLEGFLADPSISPKYKDYVRSVQDMGVFGVLDYVHSSIPQVVDEQYACLFPLDYGVRQLPVHCTGRAVALNYLLMLKGVDSKVVTGEYAGDSHTFVAVGDCNSNQPVDCCVLDASFNYFSCVNGSRGFAGERLHFPANESAWLERLSVESWVVGTIPNVTFTGVYSVPSCFRIPSEVVTVYYSPGCPYCEKAISFLRAHNLELVLVDVTHEDNREGAVRLFEEVEREVVPLIKVGGEYVVGFDESRLVEVLDLRRGQP